MLSQNVAFSGTVPPHEDDEWAPGHALALSLRERLVAASWDVSEVDVWRGSGWCAECRSGEERLQLALAAAASPEWIIQMVPTYVPGWFGRTRGRAASASPATCYALALAVHAALVEDGRYSTFRWCWDDDPWSGITTQEPTPPA